MLVAPAVKRFSAVLLSAVSTSAPCLRPSSVAFIILLLVSSLHKKPSFLHILIGTFDFLSLPTPPYPPPPPLHSVSGQLGLCGARAVAVGRLGQCVAVSLLLLGRRCRHARVRPLGAGGASE